MKDVETSFEPPAANATGSPSGLALMALAVALLAGGLGLSKGVLDPWALGAVLLACVASLVALFGRGAPRLPDWPISTAVLAIGVAGSLAWDLLELSAIYADPELTTSYRPLVLALSVAVGSLAWRGAPPWFVRLRLAAILLLAAGLGALIIHASPRPFIDVWVLRTQGARAFLDGHDPYAVGYPNLYGPGTSLIAAELLSPDGRWLLAYPYLPLTILVDVLGLLVGDVRWVTLAAMLGAALLMVRLGRGSTTSSLAAVLLLVQPVSLFVLEQAWTEPLVLAAMLGTASLVANQREGRPTSAEWLTWLPPALAAALAASTKQYAALLLAPLLFALPAKSRWRALGLAAALALAGIVPWLAWDWRAFLRGVVEFQLLQPFRRDALALPAAWASVGGPVLPAWPAFLAILAVLAAATRAAVDVGRALLAAAASWMVFVLLGKQAFCNYYWLAAGLLCGAVAAWSRAPAPPAMEG